MTGRFGYQWSSVRSCWYRSRPRRSITMVRYSNTQTTNRFLFQAIKRGDRTKILMMLNRVDLNLEAVDKQGNTVLHYVFQNERLAERRIVKILKIFLARGVDPNIRNCKNRTVLHLAMAKRMVGAVDLLLKYKAHIKEFQGWDFIEVYINYEAKTFWKSLGANENEMMLNRDIMESKSARLFELLVSKALFHIDVVCTIVGDLLIGPRGITGDQTCYLHGAVRKDLLHILPVWLKYTKTDHHIENGKTLLHTFFSASNLQIQRPMSEIETNWYADYRKRYVPGIVKTLLGRGVSPLAKDKQGLTPLCAAIQSEEDINIIKMLVNYFPQGCDENSWVTSLFREMVSIKWIDSRVKLCLEILDGLIAKGADINNEDECGIRPVHAAVDARNLIAVKYLKRKDVNFGVFTKNGDSLLHTLAQKKDDEKDPDETLFNFLVSEGCQVKGKNLAGNSPLHVAAASENLRIVRKLVKHGALVDCRNNEMQTPLHCTATIDVAKLLIEVGANVNSRDINGFTPLHLHAERRDMLKLLLSRGAYPDARDNDGNSVLFKTVRDNLHYYALELIEYGANVNSLRVLNTFLASKFRGYFHFRIAQHYMKMQFAGLSCLIEDYRKIFKIDKEDNILQFHRDCLSEIETMKGTSIDSRISLYQFLHMDSNSRCFYINSEKVKELMDTSKLNKQFPEYATVILASYHEAVIRKRLLEPAKEAWLELTDIALPDICVERILSYLNNGDLVIIINEE